MTSFDFLRFSEHIGIARLGPAFYETHRPITPNTCPHKKTANRIDSGMAALFIWYVLGSSPTYPLQIVIHKDTHKYVQISVLVKHFNVYGLCIRKTRDTPLIFSAK